MRRWRFGSLSEQPGSVPCPNGPPSPPFAAAVGLTADALVDVMDGADVALPLAPPGENQPSPPVPEALEDRVVKLEERVDLLTDLVLRWRRGYEYEPRSSGASAQDRG
jgi:hypothetical protein